MNRLGHLGQTNSGIGFELFELEVAIFVLAFPTTHPVQFAESKLSYTLLQFRPMLWFGSFQVYNILATYGNTKFLRGCEQICSSGQQNFIGTSSISVVGTSAATADA